MVAAAGPKRTLLARQSSVGIPQFITSTCQRVTVTRSRITSPDKLTVDIAKVDISKTSNVNKTVPVVEEDILDLFPSLDQTDRDNFQSIPLVPQAFIVSNKDKKKRVEVYGEKSREDNPKREKCLFKIDASQRL